MNNRADTKPFSPPTTTPTNNARPASPNTLPLPTHMSNSALPVSAPPLISPLTLHPTTSLNAAPSTVPPINSAPNPAYFCHPLSRYPSSVTNAAYCAATPQHYSPPHLPCNRHPFSNLSNVYEPYAEKPDVIGSLFAPAPHERDGPLAKSIPTSFSACSTPGKPPNRPRLTSTTSTTTISIAKGHEEAIVPQKNDNKTTANATWASACNITDNADMKNVLASVSDEDFKDDYEQLMRLFEDERQNLFSGIQENCIRLVQEARIPYLKDTMIAPVEDETKEDAAEKFIVKKKFVEAVEMMQGERKVLRRRGNLPKESTQVLKDWVDRNFNKPYPTDDEKLLLSKQSNVPLKALSHWFINYRKRVWRKSLPANHPALASQSSPDVCRRPRKKSRTGVFTYVETPNAGNPGNNM